MQGQNHLVLIENGRQLCRSPRLIALRGLDRQSLAELKLIFMVIKQSPSVRLGPNDNVVGRGITEIVPMSRENFPRRPNRGALIPRDDNMHRQMRLTLSKPPAASLLR